MKVRKHDPYDDRRLWVYKKGRNLYKAQCEKEGRSCALCGRPIDYSLKKGNPFAFELDHIIPVSWGGDVANKDNWQPAHAICNQKANNKLKKSVKKVNKVKINRLVEYRD